MRRGDQVTGLEVQVQEKEKMSGEMESHMDFEMQGGEVGGVVEGGIGNREHVREVGIGEG